MFTMSRTRAGIAIQSQMSERELTQGKFAKKLGRSQTWISQSLLDDTERTLRRLIINDPEMLQRLLDALDWDLDTLLHETGIRMNVPIPTPNIYTDEALIDSQDLRQATTTIPVFDLLSAGPGSDGGTIVDYVDVPESWKGQHAAYQVNGESMAPKIPDRSAVIIRCQDYASPGNIIVCYTPDEGMLVKYLDRITEEGMHLLASLNPNFRPIWAEEIRIYGVVREVRVPIDIINGNHN